MANPGAVDILYSAAVGGTVLDVSNVPAYISNYHIGNTTAAVAYLQIFWKAAASVTLGTTVPDVVLLIPASGGATQCFEDEGWKTRGTAFSVAGTTTRSGLTAAILEVTLFKKR
jgi:hypothetical protein